MFVELFVMYKSLGAVSLIANQLRRPMRASEVVLKGSLRFVLLSTTLRQAMERCVFEMDRPNVCGQVARFCESFTTQFTFKWFYSTVDSLVGSQVARLCEGFTTQLTFEWFFSSMNSNVLFQITRLTETFFTQFTSKWL